jgi:hypothetical protein
MPPYPLGLATSTNADTAENTRKIPVPGHGCGYGYEIRREFGVGPDAGLISRPLGMGGYLPGIPGVSEALMLWSSQAGAFVAGISRHMSVIHSTQYERHKLEVDRLDLIDITKPGLTR